VGEGGGLRERKKALTRATIEATALRRFLAEGYDETRLEDVCAESFVSMRTFFRYFTSKEDLVLGRLRAHLDLVDALFAERPPDEDLLAVLHAVIERTAADYTADSERELTRLRLVADVPVLETGFSAVFAGFERLVRRVAAARLPAPEGSRAPRLVAAAASAAFRVGLAMWVESEARLDLAQVVIANLDDLTAGLRLDQQDSR
jgi:AcrR family transcriptional regulator